ncbi:2-succinyl-6-hydroxy-2,4-cyclohexadiene-1-carboxylate synthase [Syntrophus gentianae]|uniref:2-succinyl-6-hydroxy-2,4-cyclohexadiene-1-carboxylate synthase n=1 Tax=Syntrophus gentianae TaxID=43775 RepID=A0A1H7VTQ4_9BACT|nr:2-succinyl-6-hydroxy-2,4-cyclohexadiene-1-carboxylate synthase [Syntrophus gentianae]SEM12205.1 2-succinyl-6-hydroxy-2,4-cyclohexadiene-1-carboxylate synthase [Syntrophus gentianae]
MKDTVLHYEAFGRRDRGVFVFLHGFMGNRRSLKAITEPLAGACHCLAFDLPGHGGSLFDRKDFLNSLQTLEDVANLVLRDLDALGVNHFSLYGYSMGGRVAQNIALLAPDRVERLVIESASFGIADPEERRQRYLRDLTLLANVRTEKDLAAFLEGWYRLPLFCTLAGTPALQRILWERRDNSVTELRHALEIMSVGNHPFFAERLAVLHFPLFYFCGEKDEAYTGTARKMKEVIPRMNLTVFRDASHNVHAQFPEQILGALERMLKADQPGVLTGAEEGAEA